MSPACEVEISVQNELALRFSIVSKPTPLLEYIKTISSLIGASHILAVFEEIDTVKVFFDDKTYVDTLMRSGIHVMGQHVRVDYVVPPGTKVVVSNIDPVVSNFDLSRLLSMYGTIVSPIIRPPVSDDMEFCHIAYGVRYCYMNLNEPIPARLEFKYGDQLCLVKIRVGEEMSLLPFIKSDEYGQNETDFTNNDCIADILISTSPAVVESAASETNSDLNVGDTQLPSSRRNYVRRKRHAHKDLKIKRTRVTATTRAAKKIQRNVKNKWIGANKLKPFKSGRRGRKAVRLMKNSSSSPPALISISSNSSSDVDISTPPLLISENGGTHPEGPLNEEKLLGFIDESRHNRAPIELAKKYLGNNCNKDMIHELVEQLEKHSQNYALPNLKLRISRVCKLIKGSLNVTKSM